MSGHAAADAVDRQRRLIEALQDAAIYDHPVDRFQIIETHISFVVLTGPIAYKIKKPVDLGFVDFTDLHKREFYCREELRLNRRLTPELYLDVVAITGTVNAPRLGGQGAPIEFAVKMRQFPEDRRLDRVADRGGITAEDIDHLVAEIAAFHARAAVAPPSGEYGTPEVVRDRVMQNFEHIEPCLRSPELDRLRDWSDRGLIRLATRIRHRLRDGFVRECHGDMHLANMVMLDHHIRLFDCLEFNAQLRWVDVVSEVAFLTMDLHYRGRHDLAHRFLSGYLEHTGDYGALSVLPLYLTYRALVRGKVACISSLQHAEASGAKLAEEVRRHVQLAARFARGFERTPLIITHGLSGSGKSHLAQQLVDRSGAIRLRSDVERRRAVTPDAPSGTVAAGRYSAANIDRVYHRLRDLAATVIGAGYPVIVDATFIQRTHRRMFAALAAEFGVEFRVLSCQAPEDVLLARVTKRMTTERDASEANVRVLEHQIETQQPLTESEREDACTVDTSVELDIDRIGACLGL